jgi:hypothetical protein
VAITLNLPPYFEQTLREEAARLGQDPDQFILAAVEKQLRAIREADPVYLMTLPEEERGRILAAQAEKAAPLYEADLALPVEQRELTAFTALNGDPILENYIDAD